MSRIQLKNYLPYKKKNPQKKPKKPITIYMRKNNLDAKNEMSQMVELPDKDFKKLSNNCFNSQLRILLEHMEI